MLEIGKIIRAFRTQQKLTLKELAQKAGISAPYLSQIENDQVNMNMSVLENLATALRVPIYMFFIQDSIGDISHIRKAERSATKRKDGVVVEQLVNQQLFQDNIVVMSMPKGYSAGDYASHQGDEFILILEGAASVDFSGYKVFDLAEGDSLAFSSKLPHAISSKTGCKMLLRSGTHHLTMI